jgi:putative transposase
MKVNRILLETLKTTYQYRLYPREEQQALLERMFGAVRYVWNFMLGVKRDAYEFGEVTLDYYDCQNSLPFLKSVDTFLLDAPAQALQVACRNLERAYKNFFEKRSQFPSFKRKAEKQSLTFPQGVKIGCDNITFPKLGRIEAVIHRPIEGKIKGVTLSKHASRKYYASICVDDGLEEPILAPITPQGIIGVDLGIATFATLSNGEKIQNPKFFRRAKKRIARLSRSISRKKKGSHRREKARLRMAKAREKEANQRKDFLHKITSKLVRENQAVAIEDLHVKGMQKNSGIAVSISEVALGEFRRQLEYKAKRQGKRVYLVDRFFPSSKTCNHCGRVNRDLKLADRFWRCDCGELIQRDPNASLNIRDQAIRNLVPTDRGEFTLRESVSL